MTRQNPQEGFLIRKEGLFPRILRHPLDAEGLDTVRACEPSLVVRRVGRGNIQGHDPCIEVDGADSAIVSNNSGVKEVIVSQKHFAELVFFGGVSFDCIRKKDRPR